MNGRDPERLPGWLLSVGLALVVAGVVLQTTGYLLHEFVFSDFGSLAADNERNAYAWAGSVAAFGAAFAAFVLYGLRRQTGLLVLALALTYFSLDDVAALHERLALNTEDYFGFPEDSWRAVWIVAYTPLLLVSVALLIAVARQASPRARTFLLAGLALLGMALVAEASTALDFGGYGSGRTYETLETAVEEGAELGGWILVASALTAHMAWALITAQTQEKLVN